jgi:hypothetical protein
MGRVITRTSSRSQLGLVEQLLNRGGNYGFTPASVANALARLFDPLAINARQECNIEPLRRRDDQLIHEVVELKAKHLFGIGIHEGRDRLVIPLHRRQAALHRVSDRLGETRDAGVDLLRRTRPVQYSRAYSSIDQSGSLT